MREILDKLSVLHPECDIAVNAQRLIPCQGYLVEYEHWDMTSSVKCRVAFLRFVKPMIGERSGQLMVAWSNFTHEKPDTILRRMDARPPQPEPAQSGEPVIIWDRSGNAWYADISVGASYERYAVRRPHGEMNKYSAYLNGHRVEEVLSGDCEDVKRSVEQRVKLAWQATQPK